jgi:hypothetical protein
MKRQYKAQGIYHGCMDVAEFRDGQCTRTVLTGIKPQKLGQQIANLLNAAYQQGRDDAALEIARAFTTINADDARKAVQSTDKFSLETDWNYDKSLVDADAKEAFRKQEAK